MLHPLLFTIPCYHYEWGEVNSHGHGQSTPKPSPDTSRPLLCPSHVSTAQVEGPRSPEEGDTIGRAVGEQRGVFQEWLASWRVALETLHWGQVYVTLCIPCMGKMMEKG